MTYNLSIPASPINYAQLRADVNEELAELYVRAPAPGFDPEYLYRLDGDDGNLYYGVRYDGSLDARNAPNLNFHGYDLTDDVYVIDGLFDTFTRPTPQRVTFSSRTGDVHKAVRSVGRKLYWVRVPPGGLTPTRQFASLDPKTTLGAGITTLWAIPQTGQSNANGTGAAAVLTSTAVAPGKAVMFNRGVRALANSQSPVSLDLDIQSDTMDILVDALETANTDRETGIAQYLKRLADASASTIATFGLTVGMDSQPITAISKNTTPYRNMMRAIAHLRFTCLRKGITLIVPAVTLVATEGEASANGTAESVRDAVLQLRADLDADIKAITGQVANVRLITEQSNAWTFGGTGIARSKAVHGLLLARAADANVVLIGPNYWRAYADGIHYTDASHRARGWLQGEVMKRVLIDAATWTPVHMSGVTRSGSVLTVTFAGVVGALESATSAVTDPGTLGFRVYDNTDALRVISSAVIASANTVTITLTSAFAGTVELALSGIAGNNAGPTTGPRTPLRDNSPIGTDPFGAVTHRWACAGLAAFT